MTSSFHRRLRAWPLHHGAKNTNSYFAEKERKPLFGLRSFYFRHLLTLSDSISYRVIAKDAEFFCPAVGGLHFWDQDLRQISEKQEVCRMGQLYISLNRRTCANCLILFAFLLHNAEFLLCGKNLILIGKVFSYLPVILPHMGNRTGGECDWLRSNVEMRL